jgi:hypothetical protein
MAMPSGFGIHLATTITRTSTISKGELHVRSLTEITVSERAPALLSNLRRTHSQARASTEGIAA